MDIVSYIDKDFGEFNGKYLFENKDIVQNDNTDDSYKHFFIYHYITLI